VGPVELATSSPGGAAKGTILVAMPETVQTKEVWTGLNDELGKEFALVAVRAEGANSRDVIAEGIRRYQPVCLVLMNNPTVSAYRSYQKQSGATRFPPAIIVMTSFLDPTDRQRDGHQLRGAAHHRGHEPAQGHGCAHRKDVTLRPAQRGRPETRARGARTDHRRAEVSANPNASEIKWALRKLKHHIDALRVLNDDHLLTPRLIADGGSWSTSRPGGRRSWAPPR
jgi:hypothetical protein